ncbi:MAG: BrnA antitoxin family protein [Desulfomonilaceae bacterium]|nr:BrnA antitoxin family protein [Desulfomonilaceae bacterium]
MKKEYDFSRAKRGPVVPVPPGKTPITVPLDNDVLEWLRAQVHEMGGGDYRTLINAALREHMQQQKEPLEEMLRRVIREEMRTQFAS